MAVLAAGVTTLLAPPGALGVQLPDGRAYELVTSTPKTELFRGPSGWSAVSTGDGDRVAMNGFGSLGEVPELALSHPYLLERGSESWQSRSLDPRGADPSGTPAGVQVARLNDDLNAVLYSKHPWAAGDVDGDGPFSGPDLYALAPDGALTWLTGGSINSDASDGLMNFVDASADLRHVLFATTGPALVPADSGRPANTWGLYEWADGAVRLVAVDDAGNALSTGSVWPGRDDAPYNAISDDGRTIAFTVSGQGLYIRRDGQQTVPIPSAADASSSTYMGASSDGSVIYFQSPLRLTADDHDDAADLYAYATADGAVTRLTPGSTATPAVPLGIAVSSRNGSSVYFAANGGLIAGKGTDGTSALYLWRNGSLRYIASLGGSSLSGAVACNPFRVTDDGDRLLFVTFARATADDTDSQLDVYLYDAAADHLTRVSQGPAGGNGAGNADIGRDGVNCTSHSGNGIQQPSRPLSADGRKVFFETDEGLVASDQNGVADVYEYDSTTGSVRLISSGTSANDSLYLDSSATGRDVLFVTTDQLAAADGDFSYDIYDARVGGGFPRPAGPAPCVDSECRGAPSGPVGVPRVSSATVNNDVLTHQVRTAHLAVRPLTNAEIRRCARTGRLVLSVTAPAAGRIEARLAARVGGTWQEAGRGRRAAAAAGRVAVPVRLGTAARRSLRARGRLRLQISVRAASAAARTTVTLALPRAAAQKRGERQ